VTGLMAPPTNVQWVRYVTSITYPELLLGFRLEKDAKPISDRKYRAFAPIGAGFGLVDFVAP